MLVATMVPSSRRWCGPGAMRAHASSTVPASHPAAPATASERCPLAMAPAATAPAATVAT